MPSTEPSSERAEIRETARISTVEGAFAQVYLTLAYPGSVFITKFAVLLGATPFQFGVLAAIGQLSQVFQLLGVAISRKLTSRKGAVIRLSSLGRALALFYGVLPLLLPAEAAIVCFLLLYFVSTSLQAASANLWVAWISDMIPLSMRGRFFARRSQVLLLAGLLTGYAFGALVDLFDPRPGPLAGVLISLLPGRAFFVASHQRYALLAVFVLAAVAGGIGLRILSRQPERPKVADRESFWRMVRVPLGDANFRRLLLYGLWWMLAVGIGAPFWGPFMIGRLSMSLVSIQVYATISTIASLLALRPWGALIDRFGNKTAMRFALVLGGLNPLLWVLVTPQRYGLLFLEAASSGIMWSGAGIVATNFVLAVAPDDRRQVYAAVFGAFSGLAMMVSTLLSGVFLPAPLQVGPLRLEAEQVLFGLGGVARWSTQIPLSWIEEAGTQSIKAVLLDRGRVLRLRLAGWFRRRV